MARGRTVVRGMVVGMGLLSAVLGGTVAHDVGQHPAGLTGPADLRPFDGLVPVHLDHGDEENRAGPPHEFPGRHVATGVNVVVVGSRAAAFGPGALAAGACVTVILLGYWLVVELTAATRRIRPPAF